MSSTFFFAIASPRTQKNPDRDTRLAILRVHCRQSPLEDDVDLAAIADVTAGLNGADLAALCQKAKMLGIGGSIENQPARPSSPSPSVPDIFRWRSGQSGENYGLTK
jgi:SpoVK/Ycf46/Vps4 family AAA+-type ATPase